jgi:hypothetical protein
VWRCPKEQCCSPDSLWFLLSFCVSLFINFGCAAEIEGPDIVFQSGKV